MTDARPNNAFPLMYGESASSFVLRLANFLTVRPEGFLRTVLGDARNLASAVHRYDKLDFLTDASGLDTEVLSRAFVRRPGGSENERVVLDFKVAERHLDQSTRRVSPVALARDIESSRPPYHHLVSSIRDLRFDPETGSPLISACDHCCRTLTWESCVDPASCGRCGRPLWRAKTLSGPMTEYDLFVCDLFHPDPAVRSARRSRLAPPLRGWPEGDLLDLMHTLRRVQCLFNIPGTRSAELVGPEIIEESSSIRGLLDRPIRAAAQSAANTAVTVAAAATTSTLRSAPRPVAEFLTSLLVSRT
jgi:hypothetical protein